MMKRFGEEEGILFTPRTLELKNCSVNVDGFFESEDGLDIVIAEAWAHIGKAIGSQPRKVASDVLKMLFIADHFRVDRPRVRITLYMLFIDESAAKTLMSHCWTAAAAQRFGITPRIISIDPGVRNAVSQAQVAQDLSSPK